MLNIKTFSEQGVSCFFKALGHPEIQPKLQNLIKTIKSSKTALYDPENKATEFFDLTELNSTFFTDIYVQKLEFAEAENVKLVSELDMTDIDILLISAFDAHRYQDHIKHLLKKNLQILTLDEIKLPENMLTNKNHYLHPLNWATNFAWFKEMDGTHTRLVTANYWVKYGGKDIKAFIYLLDNNGKELIRWQESLANEVDIFTIDSKHIKNRFHLNDFMGQLFIHFIGAAGHDVVKYALDIYGDNLDILSATHDANAWPCKYFAGLPAPTTDEKVYLWLQNTHPVPVKSGIISLNIMGENDHQYIKQVIPPYGTLAVDISEYFSNLFPTQFEINAGNYFVRPRYEVENLISKRKCIAHVNVERDNLATDQKIKQITKFIGKGYILSAPILPIDKYTSTILPTPMSKSLMYAPLKVIIYSNEGKELATHKFGNLPRNHKEFLQVDEFVKDISFFKLPGNYGNMQIIYDFEAGDDADGWLHAIFKYKNRINGHFAETSFGSHIFNNITTYKNEPQSYKGSPPGLSTSLFLRIGTSGLNSISYLIYPISKSWHQFSSTIITLHDGNTKITKQEISIPANGCYLLDCYKIFGQENIAKLAKPYVIITDRTCRLFGYHLLANEQAFSLDHMFGF